MNTKVKKKLDSLLVIANEMNYTLSERLEAIEQCLGIIKHNLPVDSDERNYISEIIEILPE